MKKLPAITLFIALTLSLGLYLYNPASAITPKVEEATVEESLDTLLAVQDPVPEPEIVYASRIPPRPARSSERSEYQRRGTSVLALPRDFFEERQLLRS